MNRRWFLHGLVGFAATPAMIETLMPRRTIFLPPQSAIDIASQYRITSHAWTDNLYAEPASLSERSLERIIREMMDCAACSSKTFFAYGGAP